MAGRQAEYTKTFQGRTTEEVQAAFQADAEEAKAHRYFPASQYWDTAQPTPTLEVIYRRRSWASAHQTALVIAGAAVALLIMGAVNLAQDYAAPWWPSDYQRWSEDDALAWRWLDYDAFSCSSGLWCWKISVVSKDGCDDGVRGTVSVENWGGTTDSDYDQTGPVLPGQRVQLAFDSDVTGAPSASLTSLRCR